MRVKLLPGFDSDHTGEIFDTDKPVPHYRNWTVGWTWDILLEIYPESFKILNDNTMTEKSITLTLAQARIIFGKNPEMDVLLLANFSEEELTKVELPKSWDDLKGVGGYYLKNKKEQFVGIEHCSSVSPRDSIMDVFATKEQAKSALAMAQLSQLMGVYNEGWEADWGNGCFDKFCIIREVNTIKKDVLSSLYKFLTFKSGEIRNEFLKNFEPLIKDYLMIT